MPVLSALYPIAIVLVLLTLTHKSLGVRFLRVYFWTVLLVGIASFATCIQFGRRLPAVSNRLAGRGWLCRLCSNTTNRLGGPGYPRCCHWYRRCSATVVLPGL